MFKKRAFACLLAAIMCAAMMPISTMAVDNGNDGVTLNKTATDLDANDQTTVTLSIGATKTTTAADVVFVLDKSTSTDVREAAASMLEELRDEAERKEIDVKVGVVVFNRVAENSLELTDLATGYETISSALMETTSGGTNVEAGIRKGMSILEADTSVPTEDKHLVLVSDGITYFWGTSNPSLSIYTQWGVPTSKKLTIKVDDIMFSEWRKETYGDDSDYSAFENIGEWCTKAYQAGIEDIISEYETEVLYENVNVSEKDSPELYASLSSKARASSDAYTALEFSLYKMAKAWEDAGEVGYNLYAYATQNSSYAWGPKAVGSLDTMGYGVSGEVPTNPEGMFESVKNSVLYEIQSGTVTDRIGSSFDLVEDTFKLTLDGAEITADADTSGSYDISFAGGNYGINYNAQTETITWDINVPVEEGTKLELSYRLTVDEDTVPTDGTVINAKTNESAVLDYTSTTGEEEEKDFPDPTIPLGEKESEPSVNKKANGKDSIGNVQTGDIVSFTLTSSLPEKLTSDTQLVFTDTMTGLELVEDSVVVTIDGEEVDSDYYTLTSYSTGFTAAIDVNGLYEDGEITEEQVQSAAPVVVSYDAAVTAGAGNDVSNTAQVNNSVEVTITGEVTPPLTGGTGTTMFTVGGMILLVAAGALYVANRKKETQN